MRAMDVMTTNVITVSPDTSVQELAKTLSERGISGVPVVDAENRLVGIVSEGDLLHCVETGTERGPDRRNGRRRSWWLDSVGSDEELARAYVKSHGRTARDVMTSEVTSVSETTELADIANLLKTKRITRVPVVRDVRSVDLPDDYPVVANWHGASCTDAFATDVQELQRNAQEFARPPSSTRDGQKRQTLLSIGVADSGVGCVGTGGDAHTQRSGRE